VKKEIIIFILLFLFLALGMHMTQWLQHPVTHLHNLMNHKMPYHPLLYTTLLYLFVGCLRLAFYGIAKLFRKKY